VRFLKLKCEFTAEATEVLTKFITSLPYVVFSCELFHGDQLLGAITTRAHRNTKERVIGDTIEFQLPISHLPHASRICITLYCCSRRKEDREKWIMVGWSNVLLFDHKNLFRQGMLPINLWVDRDPEPFGASTQNDIKEVEVILEFPEFSHFILYTLQKDFISKYSKSISFSQFFSQFTASPSASEPSFSRSRLGKLDAILRKDPLDKLSQQEKELLWDNRAILVNIPESLPKFLSSFLWTNPEKVEESLK
jgi:phosphatidylinositol-4,5-bisphosphate 3-kinase